MSENSTPQANPQETLRKTAEALLRLMGFSQASVTLRQQAPDDLLTVAISMDEAGILIGEAGVNLRAFEHITKLVVRKLLVESPRFIVDVNNYRKEWLEGLREYAHEIAGRVAREQKELEMDPMSSYERRIIHTELTSRPDISTESVGEGFDRRVVVKPFI